MKRGELPGIGGVVMKWFKDLRSGQKVLILVNIVVAITLIILIFTGVGLVEVFSAGLLIIIFTILSIVFSRFGFMIGIHLNADNVGDDVEPSDIQYLNWYIRWWGMTLVSIASIILGLILEK